MSNTLYIDVSITDSTNLVDIDVEDSNVVKITVDESSGSGGGTRLPDYTGSYTVTPKVTQVVLPTKNKSMVNDVTVFQIPFKEVDNPSGGKTVTIGLE